MSTTLKDFIPIDKRPTLQLAAIDISLLDTLLTPVVDPEMAARLRYLTLRCWLYALCERYGNVCYGTLNIFQSDAQHIGLDVGLDDIRLLHGQRVGHGVISVLVCEDAEWEPYIFCIWEGMA